MVVREGECLGGRFDVERLAGCGGMGSVYRARDRETGEIVALKLLHAGQSLARFQQEMRVLAELRHPGVVRYVACGARSPEGTPFFAMEWLEGETLETRLARGPLTIAECLALGTSLAEALEAAHARAIIHRDVKPSNVFLLRGRPERPKLLDFGVARRLDAATANTQGGSVAGTLAYMAPEQASGEASIDARADVFSLGLVLYHAASGRPAFVADYPMALLAKLVFEHPRPLARERAEVPMELAALVHRMLAKRKEDRPAGAAEVARVLGSIAPVAPERTPAPPRASALSGVEQRLVGVVVARIEGATTVDDGRAAVFGNRESEGASRLARALDERGAHLAWLADGTLVLVLETAGAATDLAARTARCALDVAAGHRDARVVVTTGRAQTDGHRPSGEVIDRAATMIATLASGGEIRLDDVTAGLLGDRFELRLDPAGAALVRERAPLEREGVGAPSVAPSRRLPFVGRKRELETLEAVYDECAGESIACAVIVSAAAGIGKSRLGAELVRRLAAREEAPSLLRLYGEPMSDTSPLATVAGAVRRLAGIVQGEPIETRREKLGLEVARRVPASDRDRVTVFLGELVETPFPDDDRPTLRQARRHAALMAEEMRRAFIELLTLECAARPLVLLVEDLHWVDAPSVKYLDAALRALKAAPLLVVALGRLEIYDLFPALWAEHHAVELKLHELRPRAAQELARAALPDASEATVARVVELAGGHAFFLEELARAVAEGRSGELPGTVMAMVQARLGGLPLQARAVLRAASVFGEVFWEGSVDALLGAHASHEWLAFLEREDVLIARPAPARFSGESEYAFRHVLLRDGAYALLTDADRVTGHRLAGAWLEAAGETRAMVLAGHHALGNDLDRAVKWCLTSAEQAFEHDDVEAAASAAARGLQIARNAGESPERRIAPSLVDLLERTQRTIDARRADIGSAPAPAPLMVPESSYRFAIVPGEPVFHEVCVGRWSRDFTAQYVADIKAALSPLAGRPWAKLCNLDGWLPTEPDATELIIDFLKWSLEQKMMYVAYVISNPSVRLQARRIIETSTVHVISGFFATEDEGLAWLQRKGLA
jgi:hypothetical protein